MTTTPKDAARRTWHELEPALEARPDWKRVGRRRRGPCPVTGRGKDTAWFEAGRGDNIIGGCNQCGGGLDKAGFREHLDAVLPPAGKSSGRARSRGSYAKRKRGPTQRCGPIWELGTDPAGTPGATYLTRRLGAAVLPLPPSVRWLPAGALDIRPVLPKGAGGALLYLFGPPGDPALQCEAIDPGGERLIFRREGKRPSLTDSIFDNGAKTFLAREGTAGAAGVHLAEGPLDALAVAIWTRDGWPVVGTLGVSGWRPVAVARHPGEVRAWVQADDDGQSVTAAMRLGWAVQRLGRAWSVRLASSRADWADDVRSYADEQEALQDD